MKAFRLVVLAMVLVAGAQVPAHAIHFYRGPGGGCTPADGPTTDDANGSGATGATIRLLHNAFEDSSGPTSPTGFRVDPPVTHVKAGQSITWTWNSSHCHSVTFTNVADSGFHYPTAPPESPQVAPGAFDYPILDETPTLSWTHTFTNPGTFAYFCVHHAQIGMTGTIVVDPA